MSRHFMYAFLLLCVGHGTSRLQVRSSRIQRDRMGAYREASGGQAQGEDPVQDLIVQGAV